MHWIERALANVNLEALNDILLWTTKLLSGFKLDVGKGTSAFEKLFPILQADTNFITPIISLAILIVVAGTMLKLWISIMSPFDTVEPPAAILVRTTTAAIGVVYARKIFILLETWFNKAFKGFREVFTVIKRGYAKSPIGEIEVAPAGPTEENTLGLVHGLEKKSSAFNFFGGEHLIDPKAHDGLYGAQATSLGMLILEVIIGLAVIICFMRLVLEIYERYVLLGVMYITSPLAFASLIQKDSVIFKNWFQMMISQYILLCMNFMFVGGFMGAFQLLAETGLNRKYMFDTPEIYLQTMFMLIGWLTIGQKFDQHLKGLGLSTAQTGAGIMGALAGGAVMARTLLNAAANVGMLGHKATTGQTMIQKAWQAGKEGHGGGGLWGYTASRLYNSNNNASTSKAKENQTRTGGTNQHTNTTGTAQTGGGGGGTSGQASTPIPAENVRLPNANTSYGEGNEAAAINNAAKDANGNYNFPVDTNALTEAGASEAEISNASTVNSSAAGNVQHAIMNPSGGIQTAIQNARNDNRYSPLEAYEQFDASNATITGTAIQDNGSLVTSMESNGISAEVFSDWDVAKSVYSEKKLTAIDRPSGGGKAAVHFSATDEAEKAARRNSRKR